VVASAAREGDAVITADFDLDAIRRYRQNWGVYRDRRPDLYRRILSLDGRTAAGGD
jgi:N-carbamoylputrescine amidase